MRGYGMIAAGLMSLGMLVGCGGTLEDETEALYACPIDRPCPGTTTCVDGMCRDCKAQPRFCTQALAKAPTDPTNPGPTYPYCWKLTGTSCSAPGTKTGCTDGVYTDYTCTCGTDYRYYCQQVR